MTFDELCIKMESEGWTRKDFKSPEHYRGWYYRNRKKFERSGLWIISHALTFWYRPLPPKKKDWSTLEIRNNNPKRIYNEKRDNPAGSKMRKQRQDSTSKGIKWKNTKNAVYVGDGYALDTPRNEVCTVIHIDRITVLDLNLRVLHLKRSGAAHQKEGLNIRNEREK